MKSKRNIILFLFSSILNSLLLSGCEESKKDVEGFNIIFLHHSTGDVIWKGGSNSFEIKGVRIGEAYDVPEWFNEYNSKNGTSYSIKEQVFPKQKPYGWNNYPYDYYNIWVKNGGDKPFMSEPTLEILSRKYDMVILKHCYPVIDLKSDSTNIDVNSQQKTIENYKLQYNALKQKMLNFPDTKFLVWTGAVRVESQSSKEDAILAREFFNWVKTEWDSENDNIFLWDFYELETEGELFLKSEYATSLNNSHPNKIFAQKVVPYFCQRIVDIIENNGSKTDLKGIKKID